MKYGLWLNVNARPVRTIRYDVTFALYGQSVPTIRLYGATLSSSPSTGYMIWHGDFRSTWAIWCPLYGLYGWHGMVLALHGLYDAHYMSYMVDMVWCSPHMGYMTTTIWAIWLTWWDVHPICAIWCPLFGLYVDGLCNHAHYQASYMMWVCYIRCDQILID